MSKQRHGGEDEKSCPFCLREPHGLERRNERRLFRHHKLQRDRSRIKWGKFEEKIKKQELGIPNKEKNW